MACWYQAVDMLGIALQGWTRWWTICWTCREMSLPFYWFGWPAIPSWHVWTCYRSPSSGIQYNTLDQPIELDPLVLALEICYSNLLFKHISSVRGFSSKLVRSKSGPKGNYLMRPQSWLANDVDYSITFFSIPDLWSTVPVDARLFSQTNVPMAANISLGYIPLASCTLHCSAALLSTILWFKYMVGKVYVRTL